MTKEACAAELIWTCWKEGRRIGRLPEDLIPQDRAAGYAIQAGLEAFTSKPRRGWKIAATSVAGQQHINVDGPIAGRLFAETLRENGAQISLAGNHMRVAEPEFGFRFGKTLTASGAPYSNASVMDAVSELCLTLEVPDSRFDDFTLVGGPSLIAENACARDLVVGAAVEADWRAIDLSGHSVTASVGDRYVREGSGANVLGDPRKALVWLVNEVTALGMDIGAGELVTTGTCVVPLELEPGDSVTVDFGVLGEISAQFA